MVFESLVADLLNRFLGDFVDNLDSSQLNIGIWGGDVKLENLQVKESALDDLQLPVKLKFGYLSSLVLKIPWKNLYNEPVIATIDGLNLIVVPNKGVVYNEEKAKKNAEETKQRTLARLEQARKERRKPVDPQADTFTEKMITQIIKNLQISISNIHFRFEDSYTNRHRPFAMGVTLQNLNFKTTDENWNETIHKEAVKIIYKLVSLQNLAIYWNSEAEMISDLDDKEDIRAKLQETIHNGKNRPPGYKYVLEPIQMNAKLKLNQKPETDGSNWTIPKIDLGVDMHALALAIGKFQYQDILLFLEAQERFQTAGHYLKYRPNLNEYRGHYKKWWMFAYTSILEEKVRRRRNNWSWARMKAHRQLVKDYQQAWVTHQTKSGPGSAVESTIKHAEKELDVFNINIARQQAELEIDRKGLTRLEDKPHGWVAWGKSWFGGEKKEEKHDSKDITAQFQEAMTPEEKAKLFEAIDYQENIPPTNYPKDYVENKLEFKLGQVAIVVDGALSLQLLHLKANVEQRPSAAAINVRSSVQEFRMDGCGTEILRVRDPSLPWLSFMLDTNPLKGDYDQMVKLAISPVNIKYHAPAINSAIDVFKPPESVRLNQLTTLAMSRYEEVKARSATGLAHAVENRTKLVLDIQIQPARIFVSEGGIYDVHKPSLLADLGLLTIVTVEQKKETDAKVDRLHSLMEQAYDRFHIKLSNVVISLAEDVAKAEASVHQKHSPLHVLKPTGLDIQLHKSSIDDLRLAKMRIIGNLPDVIIAISDQRLLMLMKLLLSIPTPKSEPETELPKEVRFADPNVKDRAKMRTIMEAEEIDEEDTTQKEEQEEKKAKTNEQQVQVELDLKLNKIGIIVDRDEKVLCEVSILRMSCTLQMRTSDMVVYAELGAIRVSMPTFNSLDERRESLYLIDNEEENEALMQLKLIQANKESPFFASQYESTEQSVKFKFSRLNISLHQEGVMELKRFGEELQRNLNELQEKTPAEDRIEEHAKKLSRKLSESITSIAVLSRQSSQLTTDKRKKSMRRLQSSKLDQEKEDQTIKMQVSATFVSLGLLIGTSKAVDTKLVIEDVHAHVKMTEKTTDVNATLRAVSMTDCSPTAVYKKLLSVTGSDEMFRFSMTQHQRTDAERVLMASTDVDMTVKMKLAQLRFVFLNLWLCRLLAWIAPFQNEAIRAAQVAQAAAAEKAATAAQNVKQLMVEAPPRIELDVLLEAPLIVVPRLSDSLDVIVLHLGKLTVKNKIVGDKELKEAVLDRMDIKLTDITFGIGTMDGEVSKVTSTCPLLKPLSFSLAVQRNLTFKSVKSLPELVVDAHLGSIEIEMAEADYKTLMLTLTGNLAEGQDLIPPLPPSNAGETTGDIVSTSPRSPGAESKSVKKDRMADSGPPPPVEKPHTRIVFQFILDKIVAILYEGESSLGNRDESQAFAALRLRNLKLSGKIAEDNAQTVGISLDAFTMNDERKSKTKIHYLLDKTSQSENRFLDLNFKQDSATNKQIRVKMSAFFICLCPEFLGCLARFFAVPHSEDEKEQTIVAKNSAKSGSALKAVAPIQPAGTISLDCDLKGVEVILVEDSMHPESTQALILSFNVNVRAQPNLALQKMAGAIEDLTIFSSYYAQERRKEITYQVLKPVKIEISAEIDNEKKSTSALLKMSSLELRMSPSIIRLLSAVSAEFSKNSAVDVDVKSNSVPKKRRFADYWTAKPIDQRKYWFFAAPVAEEAVEEDETHEEIPALNESKEKAKVDIQRINFTLEAGEGSVPIPLIFLDMLVSAEADNWSSALSAKAEISLQMSYYNESLSVWEPVIEPVEISDGVFERWDLRMNVKGRNKLDTLDTTPLMDIKIDADKMLNITVTKSLLALSNKLTEAFATAAKQITPQKSRHLPGISQFVILNETGISVKVLDSATIQVGSDGTPIDATHGSFVDLHMKGGERKELSELERLSTVEQAELSVDLRLELAGTLRETKVGRAEKRAISLPKLSDGGRKWMNGKRQPLRCNFDSDDSVSGLYIDTQVKEERITEGGDEKQSTFHVYLYSPLEFYNVLPMEVKFEVPEAKVLAPGTSTVLNAVTGTSIKCSVQHLGDTYVLEMPIPEMKKELDVVALNTETGSAELLLGLHWTSEYGVQKVYLYAPFWLVNNTSKTLRHTNEEAILHLPDANPLILPFPSTDLAKKKKARVKIEGESGWSEEFPLDTVGNAARITCKGDGRDFDITVDIKLCQSGLTKVVTFAPFYLVSNLGNVPIEVRENAQEHWTHIDADTCVGIWPIERKNRKLMCVRFQDEKEESLLFPITENIETLSQIDSDLVGVEVSVSTGEASVAVHISPFQQGMAPVLVMNNMNVPLTFGQKGFASKTVKCNEMTMFTWTNIISERVLQLQAGDWSYEDKLDQNRYGELQIDKNVRRFNYFANFLAGRQRILLFTPDIDVAKSAFGSWETDNVDLQAEISLQGFGLSVVDNILGREIIYMAISSSDILWEEEVKKGSFKPLAVKHMQALEEKYQQFLVSPNDNYETIDVFEVNFVNMILKRKKKEKKIRRIFEQGVWANYGKSAQRTRLHAKINHIQIDNQLDACIFPRVLAVVPPPKSVIIDNTPKPFIELSLLQRQAEFSSVVEIEYAHVLIQEFYVQVDQGLINAVLQMIAGEVSKKPYAKEMFDEDLAMCSVKLSDTAKAYKSQRPKSFYNDLHISPIMMHLSFSQGGTSAEEQTATIPIHSEFITVLLRSVGVTLTELQDVVFKLAYFERKCVFYSPDQLTSEATSHYVKQFIKQAYVLVLGLDIIGNPFGLVRDLSAGVEDLFYQPFQGAIQGPEEFATGVALGVQSMFGHAVGGAAGAVGRITGTVGKGVAALTFDDNYMRKRQEDLNRKPQTFSEGMARGFKGLGMGVVGGLTGVVTKPIEGAKQEGGMGFVKGVGKGLIGVVTRPVSGVVDFASGTLNSVRAVAGTNTESGPLRPPRVIRVDKIIRPFARGEALGFKVFKDTNRGGLADTDEFVTFATISERMVLLVTDRQLVLAKRSDVMGVWTVDWSTEYAKIRDPEFLPTGFKILFKEKKKGFLGIGSSEGKIITIQNAEKIKDKLLQAYRNATLA